MNALPTRAQCLRASQFIDCDHPAIRRLVDTLVEGEDDPVNQAVKLYYWARDRIRYNPYGVGTDEAAYRASATLAAGEGWCVTKALLLAAMCRAAGIPARVGYADVRNHLSTARLREAMQTDVFYFHGYTSIYLKGRWVKATPAFNIELCEKFGLRPLEFDGLADSLYHEYDVAGNRHMEYLRDRGEYLDLPFEQLMAVMREQYPSLMAATGPGAADSSLAAANWEQDVVRETTS